MTTQGDPNRRRPGDYVRRDDAGRWGMGAVVGVLAVAAILGFLQPLEILKALQNAERDRKRRRRRPEIRSTPIRQPPTSKKAKVSNTA